MEGLILLVITVVSTLILIAGCCENCDRDTANREELSITFGGDVSFAGIIRYNKIKGRCTYNESFSHIREFLRIADFPIVNLESPLSAKDNIYKETQFNKDKMPLIADEDSVEALQYAGIKVVALSNNHYLDFGSNIALSTMEILKSHNISYFGSVTKKLSKVIQKFHIVEKNNIRVGLLGYCTHKQGCDAKDKISAGPSVYSFTKLVQDVFALRKKKVYAIIIYMHWGVEYKSLSAKIWENYRLIKTAEKLGVDVIIGSHVHITQPHFYYRKLLILPQIGNFLYPMHSSIQWVFDYPNSIEKEANEKWWYRYTKKYKNASARGHLVWLTFNKRGLVKRKSRYMKFEIDVNDNHCLYVKPNTPWIGICSTEDDQCRGTTECNDFECMVDGRLIKNTLNRKCIPIYKNTDLV